jgi:uncharacterized membrane protein
MKTFLAATSPFDIKAALLAGHAQHPVIVHFPIALFIASAAFEVLAVWRKQPIFASVAWFNLVGAALCLPVTIATGLGAWWWQLEGATFKGNLRLHLIFALTTATLIFLLTWMRGRMRTRGNPPRVSYFAVTGLALIAITITGHLGAFLSGVEGP